MPVLSTPPPKKRTWPNGATVQYGNHNAVIIDTKPTVSGTNYHRIKLTEKNILLPTRVSADELR